MITGERPQEKQLQGVSWKSEMRTDLRLLRANFGSHAVAFVAVAYAAIAPVALLEFHKRLQQPRAVEIGPERFRHEDLRVRNLPQQEIAYPHLAAGPDQQIRIGQPARIKVALDIGLGQ